MESIHKESNQKFLWLIFMEKYLTTSKIRITLWNFAHKNSVIMTCSKLALLRYLLCGKPWYEKHCLHIISNIKTSVNFWWHVVVTRVIGPKIYPPCNTGCYGKAYKQTFVVLFCHSPHESTAKHQVYMPQTLYHKLENFCCNKFLDVTFSDKN